MTIDFSPGRLARHTCCLLGMMALQSKARGAFVCQCCSKNDDTVLRRFGGAEVANAGIEGTVRFTGAFRVIPADRRIPYYGAHGVLRVCNSAFSGTVGVLTAQGGKSRGNTAGLVQRVVTGARKAPGTVRPRRWGAKKATAKGHVRLELGAALHFLRARLWVRLLQTMGGEIGGHQLGGKEWVAVCHEAFASMCKAAWKQDFLGAQEQLWLFRNQRTMGVKHITLKWSKTLWTLN